MPSWLSRGVPVDDQGRMRVGLGPRAPHRLRRWLLRLPGVPSPPNPDRPSCRCRSIDHPLPRSCSGGRDGRVNGRAGWHRRRPGGTREVVDPPACRGGLARIRSPRCVPGIPRVHGIVEDECIQVQRGRCEADCSNARTSRRGGTRDRTTGRFPACVDRWWRDRRKTSQMGRGRGPDRSDHDAIRRVIRARRYGST